MKKAITIILGIMIVLAFTLPAVAISTVAVTSIKLSVNKITLDVGETSNIVVTFTPANTSQKRLTYVSGDKYIAAVDAAGKITAVHGGTTSVYVYTPNKKIFEKCTVTVLKPPASTGVYAGAASCVMCHKDKAGVAKTKHNESFKPVSEFKFSEPLGAVTVFDGASEPKNVKSTTVDLSKAVGVQVGEYIIAEIPKSAGFKEKYYRVAKLKHNGDKITVEAASTVPNKTDWSASAYSCAACHSPGLDAPGKADLTVSCESCHGPGADHVAAKASQKKGTITKPTSEVCVKCHTASSPTKNTTTGGIVTNNHQGPRNFALSKMGQNRSFKGCTVCHDPHAPNASGKMLKKDDPKDICMTCHKDKKYDLKTMMWKNPKDARGHFTADHSFGELLYEDLGDDPKTDATEITKQPALDKIKAIFPDLFKAK